jgi:hypothetical protein
MNQESNSEPWTVRTPEGVDDSGAQYLKSLCDRRDAAVENPFLAGVDLPDADPGSIGQQAGS